MELACEVKKKQNFHVFKYDDPFICEVPTVSVIQR